MDGQTQVGVVKSLFFVTANALGYFWRLQKVVLILCTQHGMITGYNCQAPLYLKVPVHQWCHMVLSSFLHVPLKVTSQFLIISKLLIYQGIHYMWGGNVACNSFCFPNFILDLGNILSFPRNYLVFLFRARTCPSYSSKEMSLLICPCIFSSKRMNTSKTNKLSVAEYTKTSIHVLLPALSPSSQHTHLEQVTSSQHLQFLSVVIFVRAECRATWTQSLFLSFAEV